MRELERSMLSSKQEKEDLSRDLCEVCFLITKKKGGGRGRNKNDRRLHLSSYDFQKIWIIFLTPILEFLNFFISWKI